VRISPKNIESTLRPRNLFENGSSFEEWDAFLRILFASKNKMLRTVLTRSKPALLRLTSLRNGSGKFTDEDVDKSKVDLEQTLLSTETTNLRANAMTLAQFRILFDALFKVGFRFSEKGLKKNESQEGIEGKKIESQEGIEGLFSPPTSLDDAVEPTMWKSMVEKLAVERSMKKGNPISAPAQPNNIDNTPGENNDDESGFTLESTRSVNVLKGRASEDARRRERKKRARDILSIYEINIKRDHTN
jgi:hypothetical protein